MKNQKKENCLELDLDWPNFVEWKVSGILIGHF